MRKKREILERTIWTLSEQAASASEIVDEALDTGLDGSHPSHGSREDAPV
jgi:hypothetical protein